LLGELGQVNSIFVTHVESICSNEDDVSGGQFLLKSASSLVMMNRVFLASHNVGNKNKSGAKQSRK
jgi:hypothetical protein